MAEETRIEWADHTFNPWIGCTKVSPACDHCYAEAQASRYWPGEQLWAGNRKRTSENNWRQPLKWNRQAAEFRAQHGRPPMVFCASLADVFDNQVPEEWRSDLWSLIYETPNLIWLLLTKRPQNIRKMLPANYLGLTDRGWPALPNVWLGTTVENQAEADRRIPHLLAAPAAKRFLSCEPLLGPVNLRALDENGDAEIDALCPPLWGPEVEQWRGSSDTWEEDFEDWYSRDPNKVDPVARMHPGIDWVIAGGESGREARPLHPDWVRSLRDQCAAAGVPFLFKQWGEWAPNAYLGSDRDAMHIFGADDRGLQRAVYRIGKKAAGRTLDSIIHDARPEASI